MYQFLIENLNPFLNLRSGDLTASVWMSAANKDIIYLITARSF